MLRITELVNGGSLCTLKLEGKLLSPWVEALRLAMAEARAGSGRVGLDLSWLTYADEDGRDCLEALIREGASVVACSGFIAELLNLKDR